jgi:hypothetical protein
MATQNTVSVSDAVRAEFDRIASAAPTTTTRFSLPSGVRGVLKGAAESFNSEHVANLAMGQEDAVKVSRPASEDESDIVRAGGKLSTNIVFGGENGAKLTALAKLIELAGGKKPVQPSKGRKRGTDLPAPGTDANAVDPATNGAAS